MLSREKALLAEAGRVLLGTGLTVATGGNLSICHRGRGLVAITPSGMDYQGLKPADICVLDLATGRQVEGKRVPSSETPMHLALYRGRPNDTAVVHSHPPYCTALSILREPIPAVHYLIPLFGNGIPMAKYATYGTKAMGPAALRAMADARAALLPNHGLIVAAPTLERALNLSRIAEYIAQSYYLARSIGKPTILPPAELDNLRAQFAVYGQIGKR